mmetsp:Transcript_35317/g.59298  ORF Transcript_35317/g.59298 Transcript_35317/m.59298 type:complete len:100 (+) Transcript_35317:624-923(+)
MVHFMPGASCRKRCGAEGQFPTEISMQTCLSQQKNATRKVAIMHFVVERVGGLIGLENPQESTSVSSYALHIPSTTSWMSQKKGRNRSQPQNQGTHPRT